jgi:nicotinamide phosphoribosyltransferase
MANNNLKNATRTFDLGQQLWVQLIYDENGNLKQDGLVENEPRTGGFSKNAEGETTEEHFLRVLGAEWRDKALAFLSSDDLKFEAFPQEKKALLIPNNFMNSMLVSTDSYKCSMFKMLPPGTEYTYSYIESRGGRYDSIMFFGLQSFIKNYINKPITQEEIDLADVFWTAHGEPFNREGWEYILKTHNGFLPVKIRAVPEGTLVPTKNVLATIENTDPKVPWLTTWLETSILRSIWYPSTVATNSFEIKKIIRHYLEMSGDVANLPFKLHDFGARGCSSNETASLGAAAHLLNFKGTDTFVGVVRAVQDYDAAINEVGFSIPATEHSVVGAWGRENEYRMFDHMIDAFAKPGAIFAVVSDTYNIFKAVDYWCNPEMVEKIKASGATLVIRPDSGDPVALLPELFWKVEKAYGVVVNDKGFKVLNNIRFIWGDGINALSVQSILGRIVGVDGYSADNIAFGMGGALLGAPQRDDQKWAMKGSAVCINGEWHDVYKDPITDPGKVSKKGRVTLYKRPDGTYYSGVQDWSPDALVTYYYYHRLEGEGDDQQPITELRNEKWGAIADRASQY